MRRLRRLGGCTGRCSLHSHAAEAHVSEGKIVDWALRAYDLRSLVAHIPAQGDLDEDAAMALVREELHVARAERDAENTLVCGRSDA